MKKLITLLASLLLFTSFIYGQSPVGPNIQISGTVDIPAGLDPGTLTDATAYDIFLIEDPGGTPSHIQTLDFTYDNLNGNSIPFFANLDYSTSYSWAVQIDGYVYTSYAQYQSDALYGEYLFSTIDQLTAASNLAPDGLADQTLTPTLTWDPATGGTIPYTYTINIYDDALLSSLVWDGVLNSGDPVPGGELDYNTNYWWEVVTDDDSDPAQQETSADAQFKTGFPILSLDSPADGFSSSDRTPTLTWSTSAAVSNVTYTLDVSGNNGFAYNNTETSPYTFPADLDYGTYTWDVTIDDTNTPLDNTPATSSNGPWTFDVVPTLVSPVNSITGVSIKPTVEWIDGGADAYRIQIATSTDFVGDLVLEHSVLAGNDSYKFTGYFHPEIPLNNNTKYYWRVIAEVGAFDYPSEAWYFTTVANVTVNLWNPGDGVELYLYDPTTFTWGLNQAVGSLKFFLQVIEQPLAPDYVQWASFEITAAQGANPVLWFDNLTDLYKAVNGLSGGSKFYWRVCAYYDDGSTPGEFDFDDRVVKYSTVFSFTTKGGAVKAYPSYPTGGLEIYYLDPTFYWYTMQWEPGATFEVIYSDDPTEVGGVLSNPLATISAGSNMYVYIGTDLDPSTTYYWQVRTTYGLETNYSSIASFKTYDAPGLVPTAANPSYPTGGLEIYTTAPTFYWWIGAMNVDVNFTVELSTDGGTTWPTTFGPTTDTYIQGSGLLPGQSYLWRVRSSKAPHADVLSTTAEFSVAGGLSSSVVLSWPVGNPTVYSATPTLSWYVDGSTLGWDSFIVRWQKGSNSGNWATTYDGSYTTSDINETFYTFTSPLEYGETYYWAVALYDGVTPPTHGDYSFSSFTIAGNDANILLTNPANNSIILTKSPTFYWYVTGSMLGVTHFRVTYSNTELFNANVETVVTTTTSATVNGPLTEGATYWWYVELSYDGGGTWENPSSVWKFTVDAGASAVMPLVGSPARGVTIGTNSPTLSWYLPTQSQSALSYEVELSNSPDFSNATKYDNIAQLNSQVTDLTEGEYYWRVRSKTSGSTSIYSNTGNFKVGSVTSVEGEEELPLSYSIDQNYPNPFNPTTTINYSLPEANFVTIKIYNMLGQEVKTLISEEVKAGRHNVNWNGDNNYGMKVSSGTYIYRITAGEFVQAKKMILLK